MGIYFAKTLGGQFEALYSLHKILGVQYTLINTHKIQNPRPVSKRKTLTSSGYQTPGCVLPSRTALTNAEMQMPTDLNDSIVLDFTPKYLL